MIEITSEHLLALADQALRKGDLVQCRNFLLSVKGGTRPHALLAVVAYRLGRQRAAEGKYQTAKDLFVETIQHHPEKVVRSLAQERNELINRIVSQERSSVYEYRGLAREAHVKRVLRIRPDMLLPEIQFAGCPAAYRSGYDPQKGDALSTLVRLTKKGVEESTIERLGRYLAAYACFDTPVLATVDFIIPVPTHPDRETARGYSIPRILAEQVSMLCAVPIHDELMRTSAHALELRTVPSWVRKHAVRGAFQVGKKADWLKEKTVLIIDDVMTTGSTAREVARVMRANEAREVYVIALAHTEWGG